MRDETERNRERQREREGVLYMYSTQKDNAVRSTESAPVEKQLRVGWLG